MAPDSQKNQFKQQIESEEMILKTKILEARSQFAKKVKKARQEADEEYQVKLKDNEKKKTNLFAQTEIRFNNLVKELEKVEENTFQEIERKYEQRGKEVLNKLLDDILP
jgi:hypothetical protein